MLSIFKTIIFTHKTSKILEISSCETCIAADLVIILLVTSQPDNTCNFSYKCAILSQVCDTKYVLE